MVELNLLAWREHRHEYEQRMLVLIIVVSVIATTIMIALVHLMIHIKINHEAKQLRQMRKQETANAARQFTSHANIANQHETESLSGNAVTALLDSMAKANSHGVCFKRVIRNESDLQLDGRALTLSALILAQHELSKAARIEPMIISTLKHDDQQDAFLFVMRKKNLPDHERGD